MTARVLYLQAVVQIFKTDAATVVTTFADGRAGIGPVIPDEPTDLQTAKAQAAEDGADLPAGFAVIVFPAGAVAGALQ
jgi:hypothetical protein